MNYYQILDMLIVYAGTFIFFLGPLILIFLVVTKFIINIYRANFEPHKNQIKWKYSKRAILSCILLSSIVAYYAGIEVDKMREDLYSKYTNHLTEISKEYIFGIPSFKMTQEEHLKNVVSGNLSVNMTFEDGISTYRSLSNSKKIDDYFNDTNENYLCEKDKDLAIYSRNNLRHSFDALLFEQKKVFFGDRWKGGVSEKILGPKEEYRDVHSWTSPGNYETEYAHRQGSIDFNSNERLLNFSENSYAIEVGCWNKIECPDEYIGKTQSFMMSCIKANSSDALIKMLQSKL